MNTKTHLQDLPTDGGDTATDELARALAHLRAGGIEFEVVDELSDWRLSAATAEAAVAA